MTFDTAVALVSAELQRAQVKFPAFHSGHEGYAVIIEELDELWQDVKRDDLDSAGIEAVQVAAMALRFLLELCDEEAVTAMDAGWRRTA
jgi:hypothetical protein